MADYLVRATVKDGAIRAFACTTTHLCDEARRRHATAPTATAALGRTLTGVALLGATLKDRQSLTIRVVGDGPLGGIVADGDEQGRVRGYVQRPDVDLELVGGKLDVGGAVGRTGHLHVTRDYGLKEMYTGTSELVSGEIAEDLTDYLTRSEQVPSAVSLGVLVNPEGSVRAAGGFMLQLLPGASDAEAAILEENLQAMGAVSRAIDAGETPEGILAAMLDGFAYTILGQQELRFACRCSEQRALDMLATLSAADLEEMLREDGGAEMVCHFCGEVYRLGEAALVGLLNQR